MAGSRKTIDLSKLESSRDARVASMREEIEGEALDASGRPVLWTESFGASGTNASPVAARWTPTFGASGGKPPVLWTERFGASGKGCSLPRIG
jgi:hypothetical protein